MCPCLPLLRQGALCESGATAVAWLPASASASPNMFAVAHSNGQVLFFDISLKQEASLASDMDAAAAQAKAAPTGAGHIVSARNKPGHNPVEQWSVSDKSVRGACMLPRRDRRTDRPSELLHSTLLIWCVLRLTPWRRCLSAGQISGFLPTANTLRVLVPTGFAASIIGRTDSCL